MASYCGIDWAINRIMAIWLKGTWLNARYLKEGDINVLLKWGDDEIDVAEEIDAEIEEQDQEQFEEQEQEQHQHGVNNSSVGVISSSSANSSSTNTTEEHESNQPAAAEHNPLAAATQPAARIRRPPYWMQDYVTGTTAAHQNQSAANVTGTITANQHVERNQPAATDQPAARIRRTPS
ncbi:hypothetical protein POTOM_054470 [Populus tomentosa]|uniref:Uncharacterized protein n=1 Tax=Populus tomentosa TaxID=118781 RepID=A0A8X7Y1M8_POPTO|nr:hypothetical protein POTOM_054470 [Populus tomentosa]